MERNGVLRVGMIGLGRMGRLHMKNCLHIEGVKVTAAADTSKSNLSKAKSVGIGELYTDYRELLNKAHNRLDAVIISLPNFLHFESIQMALEAGLHVFVEKPLANTTEECRRIVKLVNGSGGKFMVGHCMRYYPFVEEMKAAVERGNIGDLAVINLEEVTNGPFGHGVTPSPVPEWWFDPNKSKGGVLLDMGYHLVDLFHFFSGDCKLSYFCIDHRLNLPVEDSAILVLQSLNSSTKGIINVGWYQTTIFPKWNLRVILHGNAGYMSSDYMIPRNPYLHAAKEGTRNLIRRITGRSIHPLSYTYYYEAYYKELRHFFNCIRGNSNPSISAVDGLKTIELIEEVYRSCETPQE